MSAGIEVSSFEAYIHPAVEAAQQGDLQGAVKALYQNRPQEEVEHACEIVAGVFANSINPSDPKRIEMCAKIKGELLALSRRERGIPNFPDEKFRTLAIQSAKSHHCGSAAILIDQIQDASIKKETQDAVVEIFGNMSPNSAYNQAKAFLLQNDDWEKAENLKI